MADRYTYVPLIGVFIAIDFLGRDWAARFQLAHASAAAVSLILAEVFVDRTSIELLEG